MNNPGKHNIVVFALWSPVNGDYDFSKEVMPFIPEVNKVLMKIRMNSQTIKEVMGQKSMQGRISSREKMFECSASLLKRMMSITHNIVMNTNNLMITDKFRVLYLTVNGQLIFKNIGSVINTRGTKTNVSDNSVYPPSLLTELY